MHIYPDYCQEVIMQLWSTEQIKPKEKFNYWREVLCQTYTALDPVVNDTTHFTGVVSSGKLAEIDVTSISSQAQSIYRGEKEISRMPNEYYFLNLQISGKCRMQQGDSIALIGPNEYSLVDSTKPYMNDYLTDDFNQFSLRIPHHLLKPYLLHPDKILTSRFSSDGGIKTIVIDLIKTITSGDKCYPESVQYKLMENLVSLIGLSIDSNQETCDNIKVTYKEYLYNNIKKFIRDNMSNPEIDPLTVAKNFMISTRYLHKIFEQGTESFGQFLQIERLDKCASELKIIKMIQFQLLRSGRGSMIPPTSAKSFAKGLACHPVSIERKMI
jgi:AraC-like DNA-binding protein